MWFYLFQPEMQLLLQRSLSRNSHSTFANRYALFDNQQTSETVVEELTHLKAKMEEMYAENRQLRLAATGQKTPLDSDQPASEPDGSSPVDSPLPTIEQIELERREEERKARLLQTLDLLDRTDSHTDFQLSTNNHIDKFQSARSEENNRTKETQREITGDFGK
ncbi:hypothetical protein AHF37_07914 [Paragonimus kellicotti]|nr:hypothetical protein AHF37_07914 [Paragonimus kellicotti]